MADPDMQELVRQRSMLVILMAACETAQNAFRAAANPMDAALLDDLSRMIERTQEELQRLSAAIARAGS